MKHVLTFFGFLFLGLSIKGTWASLDQEDGDVQKTENVPTPYPMRAGVFFSQEDGRIIEFFVNSAGTILFQRVTTVVQEEGPESPMIPLEDRSSDAPVD